MPISRKTTNVPTGSLFSTVLPPRLPSAQPLIRSSIKEVVTSEKPGGGNKSGNDAVIRFVSTVSPRPFNTKVISMKTLTIKLII